MSLPHACVEPAACNDRVSFATTRQALRRDFERRLELEGRAITRWALVSLLLRPGGAAVLLFRLAHWRERGGHRVQARVLERLMYYTTRLEIQAGARIGPGLVLPDIGGGGIQRLSVIGSNCTVLGSALITCGGIEGVDLDTARITLGDHVTIGHRARILGVLSIAHGVQIKENALVLTSVSTVGAILSGIPARRRGTVPLETIHAWSPLRQRPIGASNVSLHPCAPPEPSP